MLSVCGLLLLESVKRVGKVWLVERVRDGSLYANLFVSVFEVEVDVEDQNQVEA